MVNSNKDNAYIRLYIRSINLARVLHYLSLEIYPKGLSVVKESIQKLFVLTPKPGFGGWRIASNERPQEKF